MSEPLVSVPLSVAKLIRGGCLPLNERKMRGADPELVKAITEFKQAIAQADANPNGWYWPKSATRPSNPAIQHFSATTSEKGRS